jgi:hypothetical protein
MVICQQICKPLNPPKCQRTGVWAQGKSHEGLAMQNGKKRKRRWTEKPCKVFLKQLQEHKAILPLALNIVGGNKTHYAHLTINLSALFHFVLDSFGLYLMYVFEKFPFYNMNLLRAYPKIIFL